jgi:hypothetical protein
MPKIGLLLVLSTMTLAVASALADDAPTARPNQTHRQLMKQCMAEQHAQATGISADEMKKTCEDRIKSYRDHPSATSPETAPPPHP